MLMVINAVLQNKAGKGEREDLVGFKWLGKVTFEQRKVR